MTQIIKKAFNTPYINIWNPLCKKYMWVRIIYRFRQYNRTIKSRLDVNGNKDYVMEDNIYFVNVGENNFCKCNKYLIISEELIFRVPYYHKFNNWTDKVKIFPEPDLGEKNVYTNKYKGFDMIELYERAKINHPRYFSKSEVNLNCKELK